MTERQKVCDFSNLYKAMKKCKKGVTWKDSVSRYCNSGLLSTLKLCNSLDDDIYAISPYYKFTIHEPKTREIISTNFKDRVFQRSYCDNTFYTSATKTFIYDNSACQNNEGNDFSRKRLKTHLRKFYLKHGNEGYVLKVDMKNYFGSTPHATIKKALTRVLADEWVLQTSFNIVDSYNEDGTETGVGLGSQITQIVQLLVLNSVDHHMKEVCRVKHYIRYMDDIIVVHENKEFLQECLKDIERLVSKLGLATNKKKTQIFKLSQGINYLGFVFRVTDTGRVLVLLGKENIIKRKRKIRKHYALYLDGKLSREKAEECYVSWKSHANNGDSYKVIQNMDAYFNQIWGATNVQKTYREREIA